MASKRDLVEAHAFSRRRLVTAFLSGAPGGREVEPVRQGRALVGGIALSVLLLAGAAIAGFFKTPTPADWRDAGIIVGERNTTYVILEDGAPPLRLVNVTSGMLLLGNDVQLRSVAQEEINKAASDRFIGIFGAPDDPPAADDLVDSGWTACVAHAGGMRLRIDDAATATPAPTGAFFAHGPGKDSHYLVVEGEGGAHRLPLPRGQRVRNDLASALRGVPDLGEVPATWLDLLPVGDALTEETFPVRTFGEPASWAREGSPTVGQVVSVNGQRQLIGDDGPMPLDAFAEAIYRTLLDAPEATSSGPLGVAPIPVPATWPAQLPEATDVDADDDGTAEGCLVLDAAPGRAAVSRLAVSPAPPASAAETGGRTRVDVAVGRGAYVLSADHGARAGGQPWLIDRWGRRYALGGPAGDTAERLGYGGHEPVTVPDAWLELVSDCGPELSQQLALGVPDLSQQQSSCE